VTTSDSRASAATAGTTRPPDAPPRSSLGEVAALFLKLGLIAFGGPAAHVALMREEVVRRRRWVTDEQFLDLVGAANLIPGPTSTELAIYLGYVRAGWRGLVLAGTLFIAPATALVLAIAWAYARYGSTPGASSALYGIKPVVIGIILIALWGLARTALKKGTWPAVIGLAALALFLAGVNPIAVLVGGGVAMLLARRVAKLGGARVVALASPAVVAGAAVGTVAATTAPSLWLLALYSLKIGAVVYGSGYVLLGFLRSDFVDRLGWLTDRQLIDAVAVGQFTPGPVFTTATFIGYLAAGVPGAIVATVSIFIPSFIFVAAISRFLPALRRSKSTGIVLDGVNAAALGVMGGVTWQLAHAALIDVLTVVLAALSTVALGRFTINSAWLIAAGAVVGIAVHQLGWPR
jgi:chromate transporter